MIIGMIIIALGFIFMSGGSSDNPSVFNNDIFNFRRLTLAPTLILIGFAVEVYAILLNSNSEK